MITTGTGLGHKEEMDSVSESTYNVTGFRQDCRRSSKGVASKARVLAGEAVSLYRAGNIEKARALWAEAVQLVGSVH